MKARIKMKIINILTISTFLLGCGSSFSSSKDGIENIAGNDNSDVAGIMNVAGSNNDAGSNSIAGTTNNSAGAMNETAGSMNSSGAGGIENVGGDNSAGQMNNGGANNAGNSGANNNAGAGGAACKPLTCDIYAGNHNYELYPNTILNKNLIASGEQFFGVGPRYPTSCGIISDGCGKMLDCSGCGSYEQCKFENDHIDITIKEPTFIVDVPNTGTSNICGGGCDLVPQKSCGANDKGTVYYCMTPPTDYTTNPPDPSCTLAGTQGVMLPRSANTIIAAVFCCTK
jgi:hypothetical protein